MGILANCDFNCVVNFFLGQAEDRPDTVITSRNNGNARTTTARLGVAFQDMNIFSTNDGVEALLFSERHRETPYSSVPKHTEQSPQRTYYIQAIEVGLKDGKKGAAFKLFKEGDKEPIARMDATKFGEYKVTVYHQSSSLLFPGNPPLAATWAAEILIYGVAEVMHAGYDLRGEVCIIAEGAKMPFWCDRNNAPALQRDARIVVFPQNQD